MVVTLFWLQSWDIDHKLRSFIDFYIRLNYYRSLFSIRIIRVFTMLIHHFSRRSVLITAPAVSLAGGAAQRFIGTHWIDSPPVFC